MDSLWSYHAWYTREYYIAAVLETPNANATATRLLQNQTDIGNAFGQYYGKDVGDKIGTLLQEHIKIATEVVAATKANDQTKLKDADDRWHQNFVELAKALSAANPSYYPYDKTLQLLNQHLSLLTAAVTSFIGGDYSKSVTQNDEYYEEILMMADFFTDGIINQFPDKFQ